MIQFEKIAKSKHTIKFNLFFQLTHLSFVKNVAFLLDIEVHHTESFVL